MSQVNQKSKLTTQLTRESLECMICCAKIRRKHSIWSCQVCFNVFHLDCIKKWASSSVESDGWRCPGCQSQNAEIPHLYTCFCAKTVNPPLSYQRYAIPHACGDTCGRIGIGGQGCTHGCPEQCHPGRCNPCYAQVRRSCPCEKQIFTVTCSGKQALLCGNRCEKVLNCGVHSCTGNCHEGACDPCGVLIRLECHCGKNSKSVPCTVETRNQHFYSCDRTCNRILTCSNHRCEDKCHPICKPCKLAPSQIKSCPCGKTSIAEACKIRGERTRASCTDPIPTCGKPCLKELKCGGTRDRHRCLKDCHLEPDCPECPSTTSIKCRCGNKEFEVECKNLEASGEIVCGKKCTKKRSCGKHKCNTKCCIDQDHICPVVCDRPLPCKNHQCELLCHNGHCPPCRYLSFDELTCECGDAVIYPPVPCGTKPPDCNRPCTRSHDCDHDVHHNCHGEPECPPCYVLTSKWCHGRHMLRQNILCHVKEVSCGLLCDKLLKCSRHKCPRKCHPSDCMRENDLCMLPCTTPRPNCGHPCNAPCHERECPDTKCKEMASVTCLCGRLKDSIVCWKREAEFEKIIQAFLSQRLSQLKLSVDGTAEVDEEKLRDELLSSRSKLQLLKCDKECARIERAKKLAEALQLESPDVSTQFGIPNYSDYMKKMAQKNPRFVEMVHEKLSDLVMRTKKTKNQRNVTYQFEGLNRDKRQLIYEYCEHFGCLYNSMDEGEPGLKSAIITASKEKCWLPSVSLADAVFQQSVKAERKSAYADVELSQSKSQILGPGGNFKRLGALNVASLAVSVTGYDVLRLRRSYVNGLYIYGRTLLRRSEASLGTLFAATKFAPHLDTEGSKGDVGSIIRPAVT
ncbi:unnamed protein product [Allacma fusca]|uniref:NF-X1-type zinc finger protein NFXL1 n=1 Tax=Allacma fusca TaxID=39272 RepID=A0A8J2J8U2_9HEXA|nr:unnamed protein product [Allacma fusca]